MYNQKGRNFSRLTEAGTQLKKVGRVVTGLPDRPRPLAHKASFRQNWEYYY